MVRSQLLRRCFVAAAVLFGSFLTPITWGEQGGRVGPAVYRKTEQKKATAKRTPPSMRYALSKPAKVSLGAVDSIDEATLKRIPGGLNMGVHRSLTGTSLKFTKNSADKQVMQMDGAWSSTPSGKRIWQLSVSSEGAVGLRLYFTEFSVGSGTVWVHGTDTSKQETYTGTGPWKNGKFWTPIITGDTVYVEYEPGSADASATAVPFQISRISHMWALPGTQTDSSVSELKNSAKQAECKQSTAVSRKSVLNLKQFEGLLPEKGTPLLQKEATSTALDVAASCEVDYSCYSTWADTGESVGMIIFESDGGTYACSGTMLNTRNSSFTPYFLTASHCISSVDEAHSVEAYWQFQSSTCNGTAPDYTDVPSTSGAILVKVYGAFDDARGDFSLIKLTGDIPDGVTFSGWDTDSLATSSDVAGIHHPQGEYKRIMFGKTIVDTIFYTYNTYMIVHETTGRTEEGSSGSGLFSEPNVLVGALSFGPDIPANKSVCDADYAYSGYSRFSELYPQISDYLEEVVDPPTTDVTDGGTSSATALESGVSQSFTLSAYYPTSPDEGAFYSDPMYKIEVPENATKLAVKLVTTTANADVDLHVRYGAAPEVANGEVTADFESISETGTESIEVTSSTSPALKAGTYYIAFSAWTPRVNISATVTATVTTSSTPVSTPKVNAVVNGATQVAGAIAPGEIVTLYGLNLGPTTGYDTSFTNAGLLPTEASSTQVLIGGVAAPLFYVGQYQINAQAPFEISGLSSADVKVVRNGVSSDAVSVSVAASAPGIFTYYDGSNRGVVINAADNTLNSSTNPALRGSYVTLYGTGQGNLTPTVATGAPGPTAEPFALPQLVTSMKICGTDATVSWAGAAPGFVGLLQVNAIVPNCDITATTSVPITLTIGENTSPSSVVVYVK
ncbi:MAG: trypsin-like peptidase domain-containing protein [Bryobacteraceae bacterium]